MHVSDAVKKIKAYWRNCPNLEIKRSAQEDHYRALIELKEKGFTWGLEHSLPIGVELLKKRDCDTVINILFGGSKKYDTNQRDAIK